MPCRIFFGRAFPIVRQVKAKLYLDLSAFNQRFQFFLLRSYPVLL